ncbi:hypothetical protein T459_23491 [Capsicum annuum]|uniref:Uncharacterized protein n=1 Tax=Capsicum annuum TaxID=4072 RepID=A0A2G2YSJ0_CAPAN|nr:hypothetical protein T459_23491 [Capsicum annuum]
MLHVAISGQALSQYSSFFRYCNFRFFITLEQLVPSDQFFVNCFYTLSKMPQVKEIIVICDPFYQDIFEDAKEHIQVDLKFALPGKERQDSVYSRLQVVGYYQGPPVMPLLQYYTAPPPRRNYGYLEGWYVKMPPYYMVFGISKVIDSILGYLNITCDPATFFQGAIPQILQKTKDDFFSKIVKLHLNLLEDIEDDLEFYFKLAKEESLMILPGKRKQISYNANKVVENSR